MGFLDDFEEREFEEISAPGGGEKEEPGLFGIRRARPMAALSGPGGGPGGEKSAGPGSGQGLFGWCLTAPMEEVLRHRAAARHYNELSPTARLPHEEFMKLSLDDMYQAGGRLLFPDGDPEGGYWDDIVHQRADRPERADMTEADTLEGMESAPVETEAEQIEGLEAARSATTGWPPFEGAAAESKASLEAPRFEGPATPWSAGRPWLGGPAQPWAAQEARRSPAGPPEPDSAPGGRDYGRGGLLNRRPADPLWRPDEALAGREEAERRQEASPLPPHYVPADPAKPERSIYLQGADLAGEKLAERYDTLEKRFKDPRGYEELLRQQELARSDPRGPSRFLNNRPVTLEEFNRNVDKLARAQMNIYDPPEARMPESWKKDPQEELRRAAELIGQAQMRAYYPSEPAWPEMDPEKEYKRVSSAIAIGQMMQMYPDLPWAEAYNAATGQPLSEETYGELVDQLQSAGMDAATVNDFFQGLKITPGVALSGYQIEKLLAKSIAMGGIYLAAAILELIKKGSYDRIKEAEGKIWGKYREGQRKVIRRLFNFK